MFTTWMPERLTTEAGTFLLVHGATLEQSVWSWLVPLLVNAGYPVITLDLPGHGGSSGWRGQGARPALPLVGNQPRETFLATFPRVGQRLGRARVDGYVLDHYAEAVWRVMAHAHLDPAQTLLVGHSMGGAVVQSVAARLRQSGERLLGLVSLSMPSWRQLPGVNLGILFSRHVVNMPAMMFHPDRPLPSSFIAKYFFSNRVGHADLAWVMTRLQAESPRFQPQLYQGKRIWRAIGGHNALGGIDLLFLWGELDPLCPAKAMAASICDYTGAHGEKLAGQAHMLMTPLPDQHAPDLLADALLRYAHARCHPMPAAAMTAVAIHSSGATRPLPALGSAAEPAMD